MSQSQNQNNSEKSNSPSTSWGTKAAYIGTGVLIGLIAYPFIRKTLTRIQPKFDEFFDHLTGKAEDFAEKASDLMARARENLSRREEHDHIDS